MLVGLALFLPTSVSAFDTKLVTLKVGYAPGGEYDLVARIVARHLGQYLPGHPEVIVQNVPGGGSLRLAQLMLGSEPSDGSSIGLIGSAVWVAPTLDPAVGDFDPLGLRWIGSLAAAPDSLCIVAKSLGIETVEAFREGDFILGATGRTSTGYYFASAARKALDAKFRIVTAFEGIAELELALLRGEIAGHCFAAAEDLRRAELGEHVNVVLRAAGPEESPYADVPRLRDFIEDAHMRAAVMLLEGTREFNFQFIAPKGTSEETMAVLRDAMAAMAADPAYAADMAIIDGVVLRLVPGGELETALRARLDADPDIFALARQLIE
ncbi:hypothetical protein DVH29_01705 [Pelagibacterium lacus]|uniref:Tripartite tricarboxylate transporter substrate binding protein n=2 Tax=Pelagibacterium lacus TaxID=2282655 RepID=A0A369W649_9HYPH|nr:hypothetical protein DVH29_01705 [Pelagibacterium lacus]